jgi:hypothetical protein
MVLGGGESEHAESENRPIPLVTSEKLHFAARPRERVMPRSVPPKKIRVRQRLGQYRIEYRLDRGGFATVYCAYDTVEGRQVALKIPHAHLVTPAALRDFRREVRLTASLDHPSILTIKTAGMIDGHFVIVYPLGTGNLSHLLEHRMPLPRALEYFDRMVEALAYAHRHGVIHCDIKPENFILFPGGQIRLADFGIARFALNTLSGSGSGTVGYVAPEQALGRPSPRSDVFSIALVFWQLLTGVLPTGPFDWPPPSFSRIRDRVHPDLLALLERALQVDDRKRLGDAEQLRLAWRRVRGKAIRRAARRRKKTTKKRGGWKTARFREFTRIYKTLHPPRPCPGCDGPIHESMRFCPWCDRDLKKLRVETRFPARCPRCDRGIKLDWKYCAWCHGPSIGPATTREYTDREYSARCRNAGCERKDLLPFSRYCPWCRKKVIRPWSLRARGKYCPRCDRGIAGEFWDHCAWCGKELRG